MESNLNSRKNKRLETDVAPKKKIHRGGNMTNPTDPCIQIQGDVSVSKKRASVDGQVLHKQMGRFLSNLFKYSGESMEDISIYWGKRKASDEGETPESKRKCSHTTSSCISDYFTLSRASISSSSESSADSPTPKSILTEDENLYKMSSSGNSSRANFKFKYKEIAPIGKGGFGFVYSGIRKSDQFPVAIKHIDQKKVKRQQVMCNGKTYEIILEVALMLKAAGPPGEVGQSTAVSLLDWYTLDHELILVMEKPDPCKDLRRYLKASGGSLDEREAKDILRQLVDGAIDLHSKNIFHRDIKPQNVLIQSEFDATTVRLIDFGCGSFSTETFDRFSGTHMYAPPEWLDHKRYQACPTTVWQLGALFYSLLPGHERFTTSDFINKEIKINKKLSRDCRTLLRMCLKRDPLERATLEELKNSHALK